MADGVLTALGAFDGLNARFSAGSTEVAPVDIGAALGVSPLPGSEAAARKALEGAAGLPLPAPGRFAEAEGVRVLWMGADDWTVVADAQRLEATEAALGGLALCRWQEGTWAGLSLRGAGAREVLARLCSLDLRPAACVAGTAAACEVAHMPGHVLCTEAGFELWVPRSFAASLLEEVRAAAGRVAARATSV